MSIDHVITAIEHSLKGTLNELDGRTLRSRDISDALIALEVERQVRPEMVELLSNPTLMYEYLQLTPEEREELREFYERYPGYFSGRRGPGNATKYNITESVSNLVFLIKSVNVLKQAFDLYQEIRRYGQVFGHGFFKKKSITNRLGFNVACTHKRIIKEFQNEGGMEYIIGVISKERPEINKFLRFKDVLEIDTVKFFSELFEFYKQERKDGQEFSFGFCNSKLVKKKYGNKAKNFYLSVIKNLRNKGGMNYILDLIAREKPEVKRYTSPKAVLEFEAVQFFTKLFDFYLKHRQNGQIFGRTFFYSELVKEKFGNKAWNMYTSANRQLSKEGGIHYIYCTIAKERPDIRDYIEPPRNNFKNIEMEATKLFLSVFDFYLKNRQDGKSFGSSFFASRVVKDKFGNKAVNMQRYLFRHFSNEGVWKYFVQTYLVPHRPEILQYCRFS